MAPFYLLIRPKKKHFLLDKSMYLWYIHCALGAFSLLFILVINKVKAGCTFVKQLIIKMGHCQQIMMGL